MAKDMILLSEVAARGATLYSPGLIVTAIIK